MPFKIHSFKSERVELTQFKWEKHKRLISLLKGAKILVEKVARMRYTIHVVNFRANAAHIGMTRGSAWLGLQQGVAREGKQG